MRSWTASARSQTFCRPRRFTSDCARSPSTLAREGDVQRARCGRRDRRVVLVSQLAQISGMDGVSYIVTVYNKAPFLPLVLDAIFDQRGAFEREVVIVDDGSTDDSFEICRRLAEGRDNVTLIGQAN